MKNHTFAICAYKESPYIKKCIESLKKQEETSRIIMSTSTDNQYLRNLAKEYNIPYFINDKEGGITQDWNFALSKVETRYATIAHQDDIYGENYAKNVISRLEESKNPLIAFTDYCEIRDDKIVKTNTMLNIKRLLLSPLKIKGFSKSKFVRRRSLSIGDAICCPSVTFCMDNIPLPLFKNHFRSDEDWEAWERLSKLDGEFLYVPKILMGHRIHEDSETTKIIADGDRIRENYEMFCKFWPAPVARALNHFYTKSEKSNKL